MKPLGMCTELREKPPNYIPPPKYAREVELSLVLCPLSARLAVSLAYEACEGVTVYIYLLRLGSATFNQNLPSVSA